jgi:acetylornithine deacetylase/succinyl-diaminopimelate desuccinylase-like protein
VSCASQATVTMRVGTRDLHSGLYGGSVPNAIHELTRVLATVLPGEDGLLSDDLRAGAHTAPEDERALWNEFPPGSKVIDAAGARPLHATSGERYYEQNFWEPSLDVNEIRSGSPRTVIPAEARAHVTIRLAPGQDNRQIFETLEGKLKDATPAYADLSVDTIGGVDAASFDMDEPAIVSARKAFARACGEEPHLIRIGGTLPLLDILKKRGIPTILTGFGSGNDTIHAPDESYRLEALSTGAKAARALYEELATLGR